MITSKHLFIGIVLLGISIFCTAQEVKIEFSYDKPNNSLTLILTNNNRQRNFSYESRAVK